MSSVSSAYDSPQVLVPMVQCAGPKRHISLEGAFALTPIPPCSCRHAPPCSPHTPRTSVTLRVLHTPRTSHTPWTAHISAYLIHRTYLPHWARFSQHVLLTPITHHIRCTCTSCMDTSHCSMYTSHTGVPYTPCAPTLQDTPVCHTAHILGQVHLCLHPSMNTRLHVCAWTSPAPPRKKKLRGHIGYGIHLFLAASSLKAESSCLEVRPPCKG